MVSMNEVIRRTGCTRGHLERLVFEGKIEKHDGMIPANYVNILEDEKNTFIGLLEYARMHASDKFDAECTRDREKLHDMIEQHNYYNLTVLQAEELLSGTKRDTVFFYRKDIPILDQNLESFFVQFGMSEEEKVEKLFQDIQGHPQSQKYLQSYLQETGIQITPSVTEFVSIIFSIPDISTLTDKGLQALLTKQMPEITRDCIIQFCNYVKSQCKVEYSTVARKRKEKIGIAAYSDDTYIALARVFFNAEYIHNNRMIEKAMENHVFAEAWLYLTLFFACGWRAADVCRGWKYPEVDREPQKWGICLETLYEDILEDRLPDTVYERICQYALKRLQVSGQVPSKTANRNPSPLMAVITPELHTFYGLLTLIAESHWLRSGEGRMKAIRTPIYQNKVTIREFFGDEAYQILHGENIQTRRLNKDYLQGTEEAARRTGCGGLMASAVASFARNHTNLNTLKSYLRDHQLTAESAGMVLYYMMQRGAFGFSGFNLLVSAYPDVFRKIPMAEQNKIMQMMDAPLDTENEAAGVVAATTIEQKFMEGDEATVLDMMKVMFEISQNRGQGKEYGIYCRLRAGKQVCKHPKWKSCLANACRELVFTKYGYIPLLQIMKQFRDEALSGDRKAHTVLYQVLIPRYQKILNDLMKSTATEQEEKRGMKLLMQEVLDNGG